MGHKTTKKHFEIFKKECAKWIDYFGLKDWEISYWHKQSEDHLAYIKYDPVNGWAIIGLSTDWDSIEPTIIEVKSSAFHEVAELLLGRLVRCAERRSTTIREIEEATHGIIRRMENSVFKGLK